MKSILAALLLCAPLLASAADLSIFCIGPDSDDCPMAVEVNLSNEALVASINQARADGSVERVDLAWCDHGFSIMGNIPYSWAPLSPSLCTRSGRHRAINGELTKRQMAEAGVTFSTRRVQAGCSSTTSGICSMWGAVSISCIGPEYDYCLVAVDATLNQESLFVKLQGQRRPDGIYEQLELEWCGPDASGATLGWTTSGRYCVASGRVRAVNGEISKGQLGAAKAVFESRRLEATCRMEGLSDALRKPICDKISR